MERRTVILIAAAALAAGAIVWRLRPTDEARIRRALAALVESVEKKAAESALASAQRAERAAAVFADDCRVDVGRHEVPAVASRGELRQAVFQVRAMLESLRITVGDESVDVAEDRSGAAQRFVAQVLASRGGETESTVREVEVQWVRTPDGWRIRSVRPVDAIRPLR